MLGQNFEAKPNAVMEPTPTKHALPFRAADFATLSDALDYAAQGETGANFYTRRAQLYATLPYRELQIAAQSLAPEGQSEQTRVRAMLRGVD